jgi:hypothetical protein
MKSISPAGRMKGHLEHRVSLRDRALAVLKPLYEVKGSNTHIFPGDRTAGLSNTALLMLFRRLGQELSKFLLPTPRPPGRRVWALLGIAVAVIAPAGFFMFVGVCPDFFRVAFLIKFIMWSASQFPPQHFVFDYADQALASAGAGRWRLLRWQLGRATGGHERTH